MRVGKSFNSFFYFGYALRLQLTLGGLMPFFFWGFQGDTDCLTDVV